MSGTSVDMRERDLNDLPGYGDGIAIVAMAGRFPGAATLDEFWRNLAQGRDCVTEVPLDRWDHRSYFADKKGTPGKTYCNVGGFIDDVHLFDPLFFGISPQDAAAIDPQERLFLETVWTLMEEAGYTKETLRTRSNGRVGVYVGSLHQQYDAVRSSLGDVSGVTAGGLANRVSTFLNVRGPSISLDTMCSSAAMAIHLACKDLLLGECRMAIAGGVNLLIDPGKYVCLSRARLLNSIPTCRSFGHGNGYIPAEGVAAFLLMRVAQAKAEGERILAVIRSSATNHNGFGNGYGTPNPAAQAELVTETLRRGGVDPRTISYVEAAAIGSTRYDATEIGAMTGVFREATPERKFCALGSVKGNIGHAEAVSGASQLAKVVLQMLHQSMPGSIAADPVNELLDLEQSPFYLQRELSAWARPRIALNGTDWECPRRALINVFGYGGSNVSLLVEEHTTDAELSSNTTSSPASPEILLFSARTSDRLGALLKLMQARIALDDSISLADLAYTLQRGRESFESRWAIVAQSPCDVAEAINEFLAGKSARSQASGRWYHRNFESGPEPGETPDTSLVDAALAARDLESLADLWTQGAQIPWDKLAEPNKGRMIRLPTYPFAKETCRVGNVAGQSLMAAAAPAASNEFFDHPHGASTSSDVLQTEGSALRAHLSEVLGIEAARLMPDMSLSRLGLNSIGTLRLRSQLEDSTGRHLPLNLFTANQTLRAFEERVNAYLRDSASGPRDAQEAESSHPDWVDASTGTTESSRPVLISLPHEAYEPFPLNDMQEAFVVGRRLDPNGDPIVARIYFESTWRALDITRLEAAWNRLVRHHDMLRAVLLPGGKQRIQRATPEYRLQILDLQSQASEAQRRAVEAIRSDMLLQSAPAGRWPLFDIRVSQLAGCQVLHFCIDEMIVDGMAFWQLLRQWQELYTDPERPLPQVRLSFRDCVLAFKRFEASARYRRDLAYWLSTFQSPPEGPRLGRGASHPPYDRVRLHGALTAPKWSALKAAAESLDVSPTVLLLTVFGEVLRANSQTDSFTLVLTLFNRPPLHPQIDEVVGPFVSTILFEFGGVSEEGHYTVLQRNQRKLWEALDHTSVSGIRALRELKRMGKCPRTASLPVVFTSLLNNLQLNDDEDRESTTRHSYFVNQTPQVYLDHQVTEQNGELRFSWDVARDYFGANTVDELFLQYGRHLDQLCSAVERWGAEGLTRAISDVQPGRAPLSAAGSPRDKGESKHDETLPSELELQVSVAERFQPFPLTDLQQSWLYARSGRVLGAAGAAVIYQEADVASLDIGRLEFAWQEVLRAHGMLTVRISTRGSQQLTQEIPQFALVSADLSALSKSERISAVAETRNKMLAHVGVSGGPLFDLRLSRLDEKTSRLHLAVDMLAADGPSVGLLLRDLIRAYSKRNAPRLTCPTVTFRDYVMALRSYRETPAYAVDLQYWQRKFVHLPAGPTFPRTARESGVSTRLVHDRMTSRLNTWNALRQHCAQLGVSARAVLLCAYLEVLASWSRSPRFAVAVPCWRRLPLHPEIEAVVGDFTAMSWVANVEATESFEQKIRHVDAVVESDLAHRAVSGLSVLRRALLKHRPDAPAYPVVFTDPLPPLELTGAAVQLRLGAGVSRTPGVLLDNVSAENAGGLDIRWDFEAGQLRDTMVQEMFEQYCGLLELLSAQTGSWHRPEFNHQIKLRLAAAAREDRRGRVG